MAENSGISWTHATMNFWVGCDKIAPECAKCYIHRSLVKQHREPWGEVYRTNTWAEPWKWERECIRTGTCKRVFTCSLSDFFHVKADRWRAEAWQVIKRTPHLVWLVLTKRPDRIAAHLPADWGEGYPNVWLGVSVGTRQTLNKMDSLRKIPAVVRWISAEPLLENIAADIDLEGFSWVVCGGESGAGAEYLWDANADWKAELKNDDGRRTMKYKWAAALRDEVKAAGLPFMFKQTTAPTSGRGYNALDSVDWHQFPDPPKGMVWAPRQAIPAKYKIDLVQIAGYKWGWKFPYFDTRPNPKARRISTPHAHQLLARYAQGNRLAEKELHAVAVAGCRCGTCEDHRKGLEYAAKQAAVAKIVKVTGTEVQLDKGTLMVIPKKTNAWLKKQLSGINGLEQIQAEARAKADLAKLPAANKPKKKRKK